MSDKHRGVRAPNVDLSTCIIPLDRGNCRICWGLHIGISCARRGVPVSFTWDRNQQRHWYGLCGLGDVHKDPLASQTYRFLLKTSHPVIFMDCPTRILIHAEHHILKHFFQGFEELGWLRSSTHLTSERSERHVYHILIGS